ncbi:CelD/BcsL family acetyltransferase involved in cellulose biosynthesis [Mycobacterium sp. URHB0021]
MNGQQELVDGSRTTLNQVLVSQVRRGAVIIPAYNEASVIKRTLAPLSAAAVDGVIELIVVCNGCVDDTAAVARSVPGVRVVELEQGSKPAALNAGDESATLWPRLYLDADIQISAAAVFAVFDRLARGDVLAARPVCRYDTDGASALVRSFYRARTRIPQHGRAMWGAGAYGLSAEGHRRIGAFPMVTSDDLYVELHFDQAEKAVVATEPSVVKTPTDTKSLLAILRRGRRGTAELSTPGQGPEMRKREASAGTAAAVVRTIRGPQSAVDAAVFLGMALAKRRGPRRARGWERDESSRTNSDVEPPAQTAPGLHVQLVDSLEALARIRDEWDGFVEQSGSDIYFTVDWLETWWKHYGKRRTFHGVVVWDGRRIVGVLPFCVQRVWAGPAPVRLAKFVGADSTLPVFTPALVDGFEEQVMRLALKSLFDARCDAVSLSPLSGLSRAAGAAEQAAVGEGFGIVRSDSPGVHTVFRFPASFDEYLQNLSSSQRQTHRRYLRKLKSQYDITFRTVSGGEAVAYFDRFAELHAAYWQQRGKLGHFGDWPAGAEFNRDLIAAMAETGRVRFYEVAGENDRVLAMEYCFVLGDRCYWRLPARDPDPELDKLRIGRVSLTEMFRMLIESGQRMVEGGPGHYEYKLRLGAEEHSLRRVVISGRTRSARWRTVLVVRWADLLQFAYYRGWFLKLRPKLGLSPGPLRKPYIRSRV